jgi:poly(3-hydroxybutyrate) depolymerase
MWRGYWDRDGCALRIWAAHAGVEPHFIHSGGHAWPQDLRRLVSAIGAKETVWVHTEWELGV